MPPEQRLVLLNDLLGFRKTDADVTMIQTGARHKNTEMS